MKVLLPFLLLAVWPAVRVAAQRPREANPERPTVATHAYTVAPGYVELEQGVRTFGVAEIGEATAWDLNLKLGVTPRVQLAVFGPAYIRSGDGTGVGDVGVALKVRHPISSRATIALVPSATFPTGDERLGFGAGRVLSNLVAVVSVDLSTVWHFDLNAGPVGIGAGTPQWFTSVRLSSQSQIGIAGELFDFTAGEAGERQRGVLVAALMRFSEWAVLDLGGEIGLTPQTPDQLFLGLTTNFGRIFK